MEVFVLIFILSVVQSLFGVGILLFGTPLLLLMGYEYTEALMYLLPASAALSWSQVKDLRHEKLIGHYRRFFFLLCLPLLSLGMVLATYFDLKWEIKLFVIFMLIVTFIIRTSTDLKKKLQFFFKKNLAFALGVMGIIHGLSNMGGSILTPLVSSLYQDKNKVLAGVSFDYAFMASIQLLILILNGTEFLPKYFIGAALSLSVRLLIGKRIFSFTSETAYQKLLNGFILGNALLLSINLIRT